MNSTKTIVYHAFPVHPGPHDSAMIHPQLNHLQDESVNIADD